MDLGGLTSGMTLWNIIGGLVFSGVGFVAFMYGKKEKSWRPMVIGIALMVYPYFVANTFWAYAIGVILTAALFFWRE